MWSTSILILLCILCFVLGELVMLGVIALLSANKEDKNGDKRKKKR